MQKYGFLAGNAWKKGWGFFLLIFCLVSCTSNQKDKQAEEDAAASVQAKPSAEEYYARFEGKVDGRDAVLHLIKRMEPHKEEASFKGRLAVGDESPFEITGAILPDSSIEWVTYRQISPVDTLRGSIKDGIFTGRILSRREDSATFELEEKYSEGSFMWTVTTYADSTHSGLSEEDDPVAGSDLMALWPAEGMDKDVGRQIIDSICIGFLGLPQSYDSPEELLKAHSDNFFEEYRSSVEDIKANMGERESYASMNWDLMADMEISYNKEDKISLLFSYYSFTGGAHGLATRSTLNMDLKKKKVLYLEDLFKEGFQSGLEKRLEEEMRNQFEIPEGEPLNGDQGILFEDSLPLTENFYLAPEGIGFVYNPYEVAPYVVGIIDLYLPYSSLSDLLKDGAE